ncbi:TetR family transcriptional regulator, partial [Mycobacterium sp. ITM-2017-0098]
MLVIDSKSQDIDVGTRGRFWAVRREMVEGIFR